MTESVVWHPAVGSATTTGPLRAVAGADGYLQPLRAVEVGGTGMARSGQRSENGRKA